MPSSVIAYVAAEVIGAAIVTEFVIVNVVAVFLVKAVVGMVVGTLVRSVLGTNRPANNQLEAPASVLRPNTLTVKQPVNAWQIIYGQRRVGGAITYMEATGDDLWIVITLAGHPCEEVGAIYFNDELIPLDGTGAGGGGSATGRLAGYCYIEKSTGDSATQPFPILESSSNGLWTAAHIQRGYAAIAVRLTSNRDLFVSGLPNITVVVKGKRVYDPRSTLTAYSSNTALCSADYMTDANYGFGANYATEIDEDQLISAANSCDEAVTLAAGGTETRYSCNGATTIDHAPKDILGLIMGSMAGKAVNVGGKWNIFAGVYEAPVDTLDDDDLIGTIKVQTMVSRRDNANSVKGLFSDPAALYQPASFPSVISTTYANEDGETVWRDIDLTPFVTHGAQAQRIAKIELLSTRQGLSVVAQFRLSAWRAMTGRTVALTNERFGWVAKPFEIAKSKFIVLPDSTMGVEFTLRETAAAVYDWSTSEEQTVDIAPNTTLPTIYEDLEATFTTIASGTAYLYLKGDGTVASQLFAEWSDGANPALSHYEVNFSQSPYTTWVAHPSVYAGVGETYISTVRDGYSYKVRVRGVTTLGNKGAWVESDGHSVVGKTEAPSDVAALSAEVTENGVRLYWDEVADLDVKKYEIRVGASWGVAVRLALTDGSEFIRPAYHAATTRYLIKAKDTSNNLSTNEASVDVTIATPAAPTVSQSLDKTSVILAWSEPTPTPDFALKHYEVRYDAAWPNGTLYGKFDSDSVTIPLTWTGSRTFYVAYVDIGNNRGTADSETVVVSDWEAPTVSAAVNAAPVNDSYRITWDAPNGGSLPIREYEIRYGASYAAGVSLGRTGGTTFSGPVDWLGTRIFWVNSYDANGEDGTAGSASISVSAPGETLVTSQSVDNNVLIYWTTPVATLRIETYELRRGSTWAAGAVIGTKSGKFTSVFETASGVYTYWIAAIDSAGNYGTPSSTTVSVAQPPDYVLRADYDSVMDGTVSNGYLFEGSVRMPVDTSVDWAGHFESIPGSPSAASIQDQVNAGYPLYLQPNLESGYYEETFDYGGTVAATKVTISYSGVALAGAPVLSVTLSLAGEGSPTEFTDYPDTTEVYGTNFRYIKVRITASRSGSPGSLTDIYRLDSINFRLDAKLISDASNVTCYAPIVGSPGGASYDQVGTALTVTAAGHGRQVGDLTSLEFTSGTAATGVYAIVAADTDTFEVVAAAATTSGDLNIDGTGTPVQFTQTFLDVTSITLSPLSTVPVTVVYDFVDIPSPTGFSIYIFDDTGTRIGGVVSWQAKGY